MIRARLWSGKDLKGLWEVTLKIDGVRALRQQDGTYLSRAGKPLLHLERITHADCEIYMGSWGKTAERMRSFEGGPIDPACAYSLDPLDERLNVCSAVNPTAETIEALLRGQRAKGFEGLVLRQGDVWLKVKPHETHDVPITGIQAGTGKHTGRMGALLTPMGKVGTGFTDKERQEGWTVGETIEVDCMELTEDGLFRHPRFVRRRFDK